MRESTSERWALLISCLVQQGHSGEQGLISNILEEEVVQPLLVSTSAVELATETVCLLLKIDDYVQAR
jgi:T-complex protein 1 subunit delta